MQLLDITNLHWCQIVCNVYNVYNVYIPVVLTPLVWLMKRRLLNLFRETLNSGSAGFWRNVSTRFIGNKLKVTLKIGILRGKIEIWFLNEILEVTTRKPENVRNCQEMSENVRKCQEVSSTHSLPNKGNYGSVFVWHAWTQWKSKYTFGFFKKWQD